MDDGRSNTHLRPPRRFHASDCHLTGGIGRCVSRQPLVSNIGRGLLGDPILPTQNDDDLIIQPIGQHFFFLPKENNNRQRAQGQHEVATNPPWG